MPTPQSIISSLHRPSKYDGCVPTHSGGSFNLLDPKPEGVVLEDVIHGMAYTYRFGGQIGPITILEHCILVSKIIEAMWPKSKARMPGLLHDACEAYGHDIQAPVRKFLKVTLPNGEVISWGDLERKVNAAISKALWDGTDFYSYPEVQAADILAVAIEKSQIASIKDENWGLPAIPAAISHLKVEFLPPAYAIDAFTARYNEIKKA
jgi:hypothetical protein